MTAVLLDVDTDAVQENADLSASSSACIEILQVSAFNGPFSVDEK